MRAIVDKHGLHVYAFRKDGNDRTIKPLDFMRGSNSLLLERQTITAK